MVRTEPTRIPEAAVHDPESLHRLLDGTLVAHIGFVADDHPVVLPTAIVRDGDRVLVHGSTGSRWMRLLATGVPASVAVTAVDGLIVARSAFESSVRYRSAVLFGSFTALAGAAKEAALDVVTEGLLPGRTSEVRPSTAREIAATLVLAMPIETWSMKVSDGWSEDGDDDVAGPAWAGFVPLRSSYGPPEPAPDLGPDRLVPPSVQALTAKD
ncbi:pyridoxamine 5'-phosphate oxidase family protein [uncultured Jatrophihabitans sp.]|uniref:pyridoxamine 5'-phosphate oxidase family protein n=1 Tax=uncultured Jatrophihabitans sp. TaxID=1610747 RepID=UPI0035CA8A3D